MIVVVVLEAHFFESFETVPTICIDMFLLLFAELFDDIHVYSPELETLAHWNRVTGECDAMEQHRQRGFRCDAKKQQIFRLCK